MEATSLCKQVLYYCRFYPKLFTYFPFPIFREVICHYTTLNQEVTLPPSDEIINELNDEQEFHLDLSDDLASSSDDEVTILVFIARIAF